MIEYLYERLDYVLMEKRVDASYKHYGIDNTMTQMVNAVEIAAVQADHGDNMTDALSAVPDYDYDEECVEPLPSTLDKYAAHDTKANLAKLQNRLSMSYFQTSFMQHRDRQSDEGGVSDTTSQVSALKRQKTLLARRNTTKNLNTLKVNKTDANLDSELGSALYIDGLGPFVELEDPAEVAKRKAQDEEDQYKLNQYLKFKNQCEIISRRNEKALKNGDMRATPVDQMSSDEDENGNIKPHKMPFKPTKPITFDSQGKPLDVRPLVLAPQKEFRPHVNLNPKTPPKTPQPILKPGKS